MRAFSIRLFRRSDGMVRASFPDVPAAVAYGRDDSEAFANARRALCRALARYAELGFEPPVPRARGEPMVYADC